MKVTKKLKKIGNSNFLLIPKDIMEGLNISEGDQIELDIGENCLKITKKTIDR